jgi:hypothetical protein
MATTINAGTATGGAAISADTTGILQLQSGSTPTTAVTITTAQRVGVGTDSPAYNLSVYNPTSSTIGVTGDATVSAEVYRASTDATGPFYMIRKGRGTIASPTAVASSDVAGEYLFGVYGGANGRTIGRIRTTVDTYTSDTNISSYMSFFTSPSGSAAGTERMRIQANGSVSMGSGLAIGSLTNVAATFGIASAVLASGAGSHFLKWNSGTGTVTYDTSSRLVKDNIVNSPYGLAEILQLQPRKYFRNDDNRDEIGLVADEVQQVLPEFVPMITKSVITRNEEDTELVAGGVYYDKLTSVLIKAIQELNAKVDAQALEIQALKGAQ